MMYGRLLAVPLYVGEGLEAYPWEAMLTLSLPEEAEHSGREVLQFYRTVDRGRLPQYSWSGQVRIIAGETWAGLIEGSWEPLRAGAKTVGRVAELWDVEAIRVLHLMGRPTQTSAGLRLQIEGDAYVQAQTKSQDADRRGGTLIDAWDLPLDRTWLVVVQAEPIEGLWRNETARRDAAFLRTVADGMFRSNVQAVITVPALPPFVARDVLACLAQGLNRKAPPDRRRMMKAVARGRNMIRDAEGSRADLLEMATELCVFWRPKTEAEERSRSRI